MIKHNGDSVRRDSLLGAALWLVNVYRSRGCSADETQGRLVRHMNDARAQGNMQASMYNVAAACYEEAIFIVFGKRASFPRAIE